MPSNDTSADRTYHSDEETDEMANTTVYTGLSMIFFASFAYYMGGLTTPFYVAGVMGCLLIVAVGIRIKQVGVRV